MNKALITILVVDDSVLNRDLFYRHIVLLGYKVTVAEGGEQALALIESQPFDLVVLDYMMPGINGMEVLKTVRRTYSADRLPVIIATAIEDEDDEKAMLAEGANDYITKPIDFQALSACIEAQLERKLAGDAPDGIAQTL